MMAKDYKDLRIVFMGTPEFAVASLDALVQAGCTIVGVITAPDKPGGRGMQVQQSAVKKYAVEKGLTILQPVKLKDPLFIQDLQNLKADVQVVVAFRMLPEIVWNMPPMGTINVHGSLLPNYRGAAPIHWAVINGEKETGVTTFKLQHAIDTGNILLQASFPIAETDTTGIVHDTIKIIGANLLVETIRGVAENSITEQPQTEVQKEEKEWLHAPKIFTETCKIDWDNTTDVVYNFIRGLSPFPAAQTTFQNKLLKIYFGTKEIITHKIATGHFVTDGKTFLKFATKDGFIHCTDIQLEGKKRMQIADFLRGYKFQ
jgi:methionyl-tRNA formyltransferase